MRIHLITTHEVLHDFLANRWLGPAPDEATCDALAQHTGKSLGEHFPTYLTSATIAKPYAGEAVRTAVFDLSPLFGEREDDVAGLMKLEACLGAVHEKMCRFLWTRIDAGLVVKADVIFGGATLRAKPCLGCAHPSP